MRVDSGAPQPIRDSRFKLLAGLPKPDFMVIGGAKCGTTSLSSYLSLHPQVAPVQFKEPNFWTWQLHNREAYQGLFVNKRASNSSACVAGDYSTSYLLHPLAPRRIAARLPQVKLIVLLRNPIDRAYSHYVMQRRQGTENCQSFHDIVFREIRECPALLAAHQNAFFDPNPKTSRHRLDESGRPLSVAMHDTRQTALVLDSEEKLFQFYVSSYVFRSLYHEQVARWLTMFAREQILILQAEKFFSQRRECMAEITEFIGVSAYNYSEEELGYSLGGGASNKFAEPGGYTDMEEPTRRLLADFFREPNEKLYSLLNCRYDWH